MIQCRTVNSTNTVSSGFGFIRIRFIRLENLRVENCGGMITPSVVRSFNDSYFYFGPGQSAVFLFGLCFDLQLLNVVITNYTGYAVIGVDVFSQEQDTVQIKNVEISNSTFYGTTGTLPSSCTANLTREYQCAGSGMLFYYTDTKRPESCFPSVVNTTMVISGCSFTNNYNHIPSTSLPTVVSLVSNHSVSRLPLIGGGALTVIYTQRSTIVATNVSNSNFTLSGGQAYGATLVLHLSYPLSGWVYFADCFFQGGFSSARKYSGGDIAVYFKFSSLYSGDAGVECLRIEHTNFFHGSRKLAQHHAHVAVVQLSNNTSTNCDVTIDDSHCTGDFPLALDAYGLYRCLFGFALSSSDALNLKLLDVSSNVGYGAFEFVNLGKVKIIGKRQNSSVFERSSIPLINAYNTDVHLSGNITFQNNHAHYGSGGGAILLEANSHLFFEEPLNLLFENNSAVYGGAVYAVENNAPFCLFQFTTIGLVTCQENCSRSLNIKVTFVGNIANLAGNSIYADPIYECDLLPTSNLTVTWRYLPNLYSQIFDFPKRSQAHNNIAEISSVANFICVCQNNTASGYQCNATKHFQPTVRVFLGRTFSVWIQPIDTNNSAVYSILSSTPSQGWALGPNKEITHVLGVNCSEVNYTIIGKQRTATNGSIAIQPFVLKTTAVTYLYFTIESCPLGFKENRTSGVCECTTMLSSHDVHCYPSTGLAQIPEKSWVGPINDQPGKIGFSSTCSAGYCNLNTDAINISDATAACAHERTGVLCGDCPGHLSVVFGSTKCLPCSNIWLLTIPLYGLAGMVLVFLLFLLRLTVANGTLNGLIFYGNVVSTNMLIFLDCEALQWLLTFVATINLDLGFPVCFYQGMDEISKAYFQFIFPIYLWSIAGLVIITSRHSVVISKLVSKSSVPVLATVIHISFSKLTRAAFEGLASADVNVEVEGVNGTTSTVIVWYFDGNVRYCEGEHVGLFILSLFTLIFFVIPYTVTLVIAPFLIRYRFVNRFKPMIDAYTGPYKDSRRFWFGLRVAILFLIFVVYEFLKGRNNLLLLSIETYFLAFLIIVQLLAKPYKSNVIQALDIFFVVDCFLLTSYGAFSLQTSARSSAIYIGAGVLVGLVFLVFSCIIVWHVYVASSNWFTVPKKEPDTKTD